ncbi:hypothetical protein [Streptomyces naganishii]|uniref:Lipoprotein n=1 Tax=Streptomyces naganishii JCM 4654 TaxID=1306179 RepID=A0A918Y6J9_9ACTN|nr:hypothetical protein [Streptomyces naganishii]GHD92016.1 hypothetical protein GCM10010508_43080 [Streptomyces naganishii JCM 4654]
MHSSRYVRHLGMCLAAAILAGGLAGCSADVVRPAHPAPRTQPSVTPSPSGPAPTARVRALLLPYDRYELTPGDLATVQTAEDVVMVSCMRARGRSWTPLPAATDADPPNRTRYGVIEADVAARYGYHQPPSPPGVAARAAAEGARNARLTQADADAAFGKAGAAESVGGCWKTAHESLRKDVPGSRHNLLDELTTSSFDASLRNSGVRQALSRWSACMKKSGYSYASPLDAAADEKWQKTDRPGRLEASVAVADVRCKEETRLVRQWSSAERDWQREFIRQRAGGFRALALAKDTWLRAARAALRNDPQGH